jgi:tetratricopeptide (TPR) repeat protein
VNGTGETSAERSAPLIAVAIVVGTLAAAVTGYLYSVATREADSAQLRAQRLAVEASGTLVRSEQWTQAQYATHVLAEEQRRKAGEAFQLQFSVLGGAALALEKEQERWEEAASRTQQLVDQVGENITGLPMIGEIGPAEDPAFPARFFAAAREEPLRLDALQDAANEESAAWGARETSYVAILALFAVALYLLGFSLTRSGSPRLLFSIVGTALVVGGIVWGALNAFQRPDRAPDEAAEHFARATVVLDSAWDAYDKSAYRDAEEGFTQAIELRPTFARAYRGRASAVYVGESPQTSGYYSVTSEDALERSVADLLEASALGLSNVQLLSALGFDQFQLGILNGQDTLVQEGIRATRQAIALDPDDPALRFNLGLALLGAGRVEEARGAYDEAILHTVYSDVAAQIPRGEDPFVVAGALTDLEFLLRHRPALTEDIRAIKERIVGASMTGLPDPATSSASFTGLNITVFPADISVQWATTQGFDADEDRVAVEWYYDDAEASGWYVLPEVSGSLGVVPGEDWSLEDGGNSLRPYLSNTKPARCLRDGRYRVEVYVNGHLAGEVEEDINDVFLLFPSTDLPVNVGMCRPREWVASDLALPGFLTGYISEDRTGSAHAFRFTVPREEAQNPETLSEFFLDLAVRYVGQSLQGQDPQLEVARNSSYFLGLSGPIVNWYTYTGGTMLAGAGVDVQEGAVYVGVVTGPAPTFTSSSPYGTFDSLFDSLVRLRPLEI